MCSGVISDDRIGFMVSFYFNQIAVHLGLGGKLPAINLLR